jgi:hypothetical protein
LRRSIRCIRVARIAARVVSTNPVIVLARSGKSAARIRFDICAYCPNLRKCRAISRTLDLEPCFVSRIVGPRQVDLTRRCCGSCQVGRCRRGWSRSRCRSRRRRWCRGWRWCRCRCRGRCWRRVTTTDFDKLRHRRNAIRVEDEKHVIAGRSGVAAGRSRYVQSTASL